jgi:RNA polymerase sigma-70 factor, ECF subfamily
MTAVPDATIKSIDNRSLRCLVPNSIRNRIVHDEELIVRLQRGDEWAFQLLVRRFRKKIFSVAFGITLDAAESRAIVKDVFFRVYGSILDFKGDASLATWLQRITVNRCLDWKRRWGRRFQWLNRAGSPRAKIVDQEIDLDLPSADRRGVDATTRKRIDRALKNLSDQSRTVFVLREIEDLSYEDIAYVTGIKLGTVRSRLFHARRQLRSLLQPVAVEDKDTL